jgi:hypothetical protein
LIIGKKSTGTKKTPVLADLIELSTDCEEFIVIDDNLAPYSHITRAEPSRNYPTWNPCKLTTIVVPLYTRINLEAYQAKEYFSKMKGRIGFLGEIPDGSSYRMFLASGRSYRDYIQRNKSIASELKDMLTRVMMAKFIWVFEVYLQGTPDVSGLMILDATEPNIEGTLPLTLVYWNDKGMVKDGNIFWQFNVVSQPFKGFNNLVNYKTPKP